MQIRLTLQEKRFEEAENWCRKAIEKTEPHYFGTHSSLKERLRTIREKTGDRLGAVAFYADTFFANPSLHTFQELCKAARKVRVGTVVETWARHFLETGRLPQKKGRRRKGEPDRKWPLPETGFQEDGIRHSEGPITETLIEIAIAEKKPDEVLKWYDLAASHSVRGWGYEPLSLAEAIKGKYPDRAVEIWKAMAESAISRVQVSGYQEAGGYLRKVRDTLKRLKKPKEWETYLSALKSKNKNRPRCVEVLDGLSGKRIVSMGDG